MSFVLNARRRRSWFAGWALGFVLIWVSPAAVLCGVDAPRPKPVVILVSGIVEDLNRPSEVWGRCQEKPDGTRHWTGMIHFLQCSGYRFGGFVNPGREAQLLPRDLDTTGVAGDPQTADVFALQYSRKAATDGIALKAIELAGCIAQVRAYTGRREVHLVAHSAGGLVARVYLQSALPDVLCYRHDVNRLITISTPHLGSAMAEHLGDWLGTRATSLQTTASLLTELNDQLELPADVFFSSVVVRGVGKGVTGTGEKYDALVDQEFVKTLPIDFREGGDEVLNVRTQNLRLARCAGRYETSTGCAVQYVAARVRRPDDDIMHTAAVNDGQVQDWVHAFLSVDDHCWRGYSEPEERAKWLSRQASYGALNMVERQVLDDYWATRVFGARLSVACLEHDQDRYLYGFLGDADCRCKMLGFKRGTDAVSGTFWLKTDNFGRIRGLEADQSGQHDLSKLTSLPVKSQVWKRDY